MRKIGFFIIVLVLSTIACGVFSGGDSEEVPTESSPTEVAEVLEPPEENAPAATKAPAATEVSKSPGKDVPIEPKPKKSEVEATPALIEMPISPPEEGLADDVEEIYFAYEVEQYQGGVEITLLDFRAFKQDFSETEKFIGIIRNDGSVNLINLIVYIAALDVNGDELASTNDLTNVADFPVGGIAGFSFSSHGEGFPEETDRLLITFSGFERQEWHTKTQEYEILTVEGEQIPHLVWGTVYDIKVNFRSHAEYDTWVIHAGALLFNSAGRISGVCAGENPETRSTYLPPSEEGEIEFSCKSVYGKVDNFDITVEGSFTPEYRTTPTEDTN